MTRKIIDFHCHIGDVTNTGYRVTFKTIGELERILPDVAERNEKWDPFADAEKEYYNAPLIDGSEEQFQLMCEATSRRNHMNILEKNRASLDEFEITNVVASPIAPNNSFEEMLLISKMDSRYLPFTSPDFSKSMKDVMNKVIYDVYVGGAYGIKIHPSVQDIQLTDEKVLNLVEAFENTDIPFLIHCGRIEDLPHPEYAEVERFIELANKFPNATLVAAHAGGYEPDEPDRLAEGTKGLKNIYVDTTMRPASQYKRLIDLFGADRVLFGTDNPFGAYEPSVTNAIEGLKYDEDILNKVLYENAARILGLK